MIDLLKNKKIIVASCLVVGIFVFGFANAQTESQDVGDYELVKLTEYNDFMTSEKPDMEFEFSKKKRVFGNFTQWFMSIFVDEYENMTIVADVLDIQGEAKQIKPEINKTVEESSLFIALKSSKIVR